METDSAFVRADGVVELHAVADVVLNFAVVVEPCHTEGDDAVGFDHALDDAVSFKLGVTVVDVFNRKKHLAHCLQVLFFSRMLCFQGVHDIIYIHSYKLYELG